MAFWKISILPVALSALALAAGSFAETPGETGTAEEAREDAFYIKVADADTRVMIAQVNLSVGKLVFSDADEPVLVGRYAIDVPIRSSKDETGDMRLPLDQPLATYLREGGVLTGRGLSHKRPDHRRAIVCKIIPSEEDPREGDIELSVETESRTLEFSTTYELVGEVPEVARQDERLASAEPRDPKPRG